MITDGELTQWAEDYKLILNEPSVRQRLVSRDLGYLSISEENPRSIVWEQYGSRGTIQLRYEGGEDGHFMSYWPDGDKIIVFDPSYGTGGAFPPLDWWKIGLDRAFGSYLWYENVVPLQLSIPSDPDSPDDTWCQTWSLAMLDSDLQTLVQAAAEQRRTAAERRFQVFPLVHAYARMLKASDFSHLDSPVRRWERHLKIVGPHAEIDFASSFYRFYEDAKRHVPVTPYYRDTRPRFDTSARRRLSFE